MLIDGADSLCRDLLDRLFVAETSEEMERSFESLGAEFSYRRSLREKTEREHRRKTGAPTHLRLVDQAAVDAAFDEWVQLTSDGPAADDTEEGAD